MTSHALYSWYHRHYIWHVIYCVWYHIHYIYDITQWLYLWHHTLYVYDISTLYGIKHIVMTTQTLCNFTGTMSDITPTLSVSSHQIYPFYQTQCMYDITVSICMTLHPVFITSHNFMYDISSTISDITSTVSDLTSTVSVSSHPLYWWYLSPYMYDITSSIHVTSYPLYLWHNIYYVWHHNTLWHHLHYRWHHIHSITPNLSIYDITSTSSMTSHTLYQTLHPLYLYDHILSTDITPNFEWHHTHYMCDIICTIYNISSTPYVITLLYLWHHNLYIWNHIQYVGQYIHYICDITATNLCHHTYCIENITPTQVWKSSHFENVWHHTHSTWHHIHTLLHQSSVFITSQPLHSWHHISYMWHHIHSLWHIPYTCDITATISLTSHPLGLWIHI